MTIKWPARNARVIPTAANSIVVTLTQGSKTMATSGPIARPTNGGTSTWTTPGLQPGTYAIQAQAFPRPNGTGTAQASGGSSISIVYNQTSQASVTMGSTVTALNPSPNTLIARRNLNMNVSAAATNAAGDVVMVADSDIQWKIGDATVLKLVSGGVNAVFEGLKLGTTTVTCTFTGVESSLGQSPVSSPVTTCQVTAPGLATTGWPTQWGNFQGLSTNSAPAATGQAAWTSQSPIGSPIGVAPDGSFLTLSSSGGPWTLNDYNPDGSLRWNSPFQGDFEFFNTFAIAADGSVYVEEGQSNNQSIVVLNGTTGSQIASYPTPWLSSFNLGQDGTLYWCSSTVTGALTAVNPDGTTKWSLPFNEFSAPEPVFGPDGTIYVLQLTNSTQASDVMSISPSGNVNWDTPMTSWAPGGNKSQLAIGDDGTIYACNGIVLTALGHGGNVKWTTSQNVGSHTQSSSICIDSSGFIYTLGTNDIWRTDPSSGNSTSILNFGGGAGAAAVEITNGNVLYCVSGGPTTSNSGLVARDTNGSVLWNISPPQGSYVYAGFAPIGPDGSVYFVSNSNKDLIKVGGSGSAARK